MTAQEIFKKLGYIETYHDDYEIVYSLYIGNEKVAKISFDLINKTFVCDCYGRAMNIDIKTLKAINQQCKELGWLDETVL